MRRLCVIALCATFAVAMSTGCGGGDDPTPDAGPPPPPPRDAGPPDAGPKPDAGPLDLLPPTVLSHAPANGAIGVPPETQIEVTFSEAMQTDRGTLQIVPSTGLPNGGVLTARPEDWDFTRRTARFSFPQGLPLRAKLTVSISNFSDQAGNPMQGVVTFSFTVSDGVAPTVSSSSPAENASSVPLSTSEVVLHFSQPMDTTAGTLVPGGGLNLGAASWTGNQTLKAPITSALANNAHYSVRLDNFRNVNAKALDGAIYLGDGKLDFGTGPDTIPPTVRESSPREGAQEVPYESTRFIVFTFSEPMNTSLGRAELSEEGGGTRTVLTPSWSADGFTVTYDSQFRLSPGKAMQVTLTGFKDGAGNALNATSLLGSNGALDFTVAPDTVKPYVTQTNVPDGATDVYPVEVYVTGGNPPTGYRKVFTFRFSEPMDGSVSRVTLHEALNPSSFRDLAGVWSSDRLTMTVTLVPVSTGQLPLLGDTSYYLDLTRLQDARGNALDATLPVLGNGRLDFRTLLSDPDLNHGCEHALVQTPMARTATSTVTGATPRTEQIHTLYEVTLPSNGTSFSGFTRAQLIGNRSQPLFMNGPVQVTVTDPESPSTGIGVTLVPVPAACAPITHVARFNTPVTSEVHLRFAHSQPRFRLVLEEAF